MQVSECNIDDVVSCEENQTIELVAKALKMHKLRHLVVVTKDDKPVGIISAIDIVNRIVAEGKDYKKSHVKEAMTVPIDVVNENDDISYASAKMIKLGTYSLPVVNKEGKLTGMLSHMAIAKKLAETKK